MSVANPLAPPPLPPGAANPGGINPKTLPSGKSSQTFTPGPITRQAFAEECLLFGNLPNTGQNVAALIAWMNFEGNPLPCPETPATAGAAKGAAWNPMATTLKDNAGVGCKPCNSAGVCSYGSPAQGVAAWFQTLGISGNGYENILQALKAGNNGPGVVDAVSRSKWGSHPKQSDYLAALSNPSMGQVVIGCGSLDPNLSQTDLGQAVPINDPLSSIIDQFTKLVSFIGQIFSWQTWKRVLGVLGGAALVFAGWSFIRRDTFAQVRNDLTTAAALAG